MPGQKSIHDLDEKELDLYFKTLVSMANIDGEFDRKERAFIEDQAALVSFDMTKYLDHPEPNMKFLAGEEISDTCGKVILRDCLLLCYADGIFHEFEKRAVADIAELLGVDDKDFAKIDEWRNGVLGRL